MVQGCLVGGRPVEVARGGSIEVAVGVPCGVSVTVAVIVGDGVALAAEIAVAAGFTGSTGAGGNPSA
jgi:hypothetical protein